MNKKARHIILVDEKRSGSIRPRQERDRSEDMSDLVKVAVDAMGGDNAPDEIVKGAVDAVRANENVQVVLVGVKDRIDAVLASCGEYPADRLSVQHASEVIETGEPPVDAIRRKKDSSMVVGLKMVRSGECEAFVTAGSSGAVLAGGQLLVKRIRGIERAALAPILPSAKGPVLLIDCGANMDPRPSQLVQFAQMGSVYYEHMCGVKDPQVAIVNVGTEEEKGNALVKEVYPLLRECTSINFTGNIESREIPAGGAQVVVTDAFTGNAILKTYEGTASVLLHAIKDALMTDLRSKIGGLLIKPAVKGLMKKFDASEYGGAPLLGLKALVVKSHGNSDAKEIKNAIFQCMTFYKEDVNSKIKEAVSAPSVTANEE